MEGHRSGVSRGPARAYGEDVIVRDSFMASGAQARAIVSGFEADVAALSLDPDVELIRQAGLIEHDWRAGRTAGS